MYVCVCGLVAQLDGMTEDNIRALKVDNGQPIIYNFDSEMNVVGKPDEIGFRGTFLREKSLDTQVGGDIEACRKRLISPC